MRLYIKLRQTSTTTVAEEDAAGSATSRSACGYFRRGGRPLAKVCPRTRPVAIFEQMLRRHPELGGGIRRTLERHIRSWRAIHGEAHEAIFHQAHASCRVGLSDFSDVASLAITVAGQPLDHRLNHFRLRERPWAQQLASRMSGPT